MLNKPFLISGERTFRFGELLYDLSTATSYSPCIYLGSNSPYEIFRSLCHSLSHQHPVILLDGDLSAAELNELGIGSEQLAEIKQCGPDTVATFPDFLSRVRSLSHWTISLFTSGTTGRPKMVTHSFDSLTRGVKCGERHRDDIWALAYNPTHMAGLQVFFQALLNQNTIVDVFGDHAFQLETLISEYGITHISATPTYYRNALPYLKHPAISVRRVTFGGEKIDPRTVQLAGACFPEAELRNIYASTELGALLSAKGDVFEIPEPLRSLVQVRREELYVHRSLLGSSESYVLESDWYGTGDMVDVVAEGQFRFRSRKSELINVGGYKVNPSEVEALLLEVPGVLDVMVHARSNPVTGQILVADIVRQEGSEEKALKVSLKRHAAAHLQPWKVPRVIYFVDSIELTRSGKKVRNAMGSRHG